MIDDYNMRQVDRVSPECPVPISRVAKETPKQYPGGAGNVCLQMQHFNADVFLIGLLDGDAQYLYRKPMLSIFMSDKFNIDHCVMMAGGGTVPRKVRFYDHNYSSTSLGY